MARKALAEDERGETLPLDDLEGGQSCPQPPFQAACRIGSYPTRRKKNLRKIATDI